MNTSTEVRQEGARSDAQNGNSMHGPWVMAGHVDPYQGERHRPPGRVNTTGRFGRGQWPVTDQTGPSLGQERLRAVKVDIASKAHAALLPTQDNRTENRHWTPAKSEMIEVRYPVRHPLDLETRSFFAKELLNIAEQPDIKSILERLPPDDGRQHLLCSQEMFLTMASRYLSAELSPPVSNVEDAKAFLHYRFNHIFDGVNALESTPHPHDEQGWFRVFDYDDHDRFLLYDLWNTATAGDCEGCSEFRTDSARRSLGRPWLWPTDWSLDYSHSECSKDYRCYPVLAPKGRSIKTAPWRRIIWLHGLSRLVNQDGSVRNPWVCENVISRSIGTVHTFKGEHTFSISFYALWLAKDRTETDNVPLSRHEIGNLYPIDDLLPMAELSTITIVATPANEALDDHGYWTLLIDDPSIRLMQADGREPVQTLDLETILRRVQSRHVEVALLNLVSFALDQAFTQWNNMDWYLSRLLKDIMSSILTPSLHDRLLFDDSTFERSRRYFWAVDALVTYLSRIDDTGAKWQEYKDAHLSKLRSINEDQESAQIERLLGRAESRMKGLKVIRGRFQDRYDRITSQREALFTASSLVDSRASNALGQKVALLTYVTIFYLPLSFCTSLMSTQPTFEFSTTLGLLMLITSLVTYLLVFNLERLVDFVHDVYIVFRKAVIRSIDRDLATQSWSERAARFTRFKAEVRDPKPSEWLICLAMFLVLYKKMLWIVASSVPSVLERRSAYLRTFVARHRLPARKVPSPVPGFHLTPATPASSFREDVTVHDRTPQGCPVSMVDESKLENAQWPGKHGCETQPCDASAEMANIVYIEDTDTPRDRSGSCASGKKERSWFRKQLSRLREKRSQKAPSIRSTSKVV